MTINPDHMLNSIHMRKFQSSQFPCYQSAKLPLRARIRPRAINQSKDNYYPAAHTCGVDPEFIPIYCETLLGTTSLFPADVHEGYLLETV